MIKTIKDQLNNYHKHHDEFHQAVLEVFEDVNDFYRSNPQYEDYAIAERMIEPDRVIQFRVTWMDDKRDIQVNRGWRVQFNNAIGAYKGGLRFHPSVNESILKFLGFEQCFKNALTGMPMGGGKGGADFDPKGKSNNEVMRFCQAFMEELRRHIGPNVDVPAGDINVGTREIGYLFGHYLKIENQFQGVITGKGPNFGGSCGRIEATGYGCIYFLKEMLNAHDQNIKDKTVIISGAGNVALHAAEKAIAEGAKVLCLSDSKGLLYFKDGLNQDDLKEIKTIKTENHGALKDFKGGDYKDGAEPWDIKADIALPCATQNEVDEKEAKKLVKNGVIAIAEGANMPLTAKAQNIILQNKVIYGPAKAANAGGVAVSGLERTQNAEMRSWSLERVDNELREIMKNIHDRSTEHIHRVDGIYNYRKGANIASFKKIADTLVAYGIK